MNNHVHKEQKRFEAYLQHSGLTLTAGRASVFAEVMKAHGHFAPEELAKKCKERKVSRATVYRCLKEMLEAGVIRETAFGEKHKLYEHLYDEKPHHHARCIRCGSNIEFPDLQEDTVYRPLLEKQGFKILGHEMHFYGICKKCHT